MHDKFKMYFNWNFNYILRFVICVDNKKNKFAQQIAQLFVRVKRFKLCIKWMRPVPWKWELSNYVRVLTRSKMKVTTVNSNRMWNCEKRQSNDILLDSSIIVRRDLIIFILKTIVGKENSKVSSTFSSSEFIYSCVKCEWKYVGFSRSSFKVII